MLSCSLPEVDTNCDRKYHAQSLNQHDRKKIALDAMFKRSITDIAAKNHVSRKFVKVQKIKAESALDNVFKMERDQNEKVLFNIPVTKSLLQQMVLVLILRCHSSYRGVIGFFEDLFGFSISLGNIHNIVSQAIPVAEKVTESIRLSGIEVGAHDEIYQSNSPILVGVDAHSSYIYILSEHGHCDGDTWGVEILDAMDLGFEPKSIVADLGPGLRKGHGMVLPHIPYYADLFHLTRDMAKTLNYYHKKLEAAVTSRKTLDDKMAMLNLRGKNMNKHSRCLGRAREKERSLTDLTESLEILTDWLRHDILSLFGPDYATRCELFDFIVAELYSLEQGRTKVIAIRKCLENHKLEFLAFAKDLELKIKEMSTRHEVSMTDLQAVIKAVGFDDYDFKKHQMMSDLWHKIGEKFLKIKTEVEELLSNTVRASSIVENTNSVLRNYFFLRRSAGPEFLKLLQFYLNHRMLKGSVNEKRKNKSPREALTGKQHDHWLELLGYQRLAGCA